MAAQTVQNQKTSVARAACALHATNRWAVSGTPIQNKLTDLESVFNFLRVYPFCEPRVFNREILQPWLRNEPQGFLRLKTLVNCVTLCRTKAVVTLPERNDLIHWLDFSAEEHEVYESAKLRTIQLLDNANAIDYTKRKTYLNALQWLNALRLICNHGIMHSTREIAQVAVDKSVRSGTWSQASAQAVFENMLSAGAAICVGCSLDLTEVRYANNDLPTTKVPKPQLSECMFLLCSSCLLRRHTDSSTSSACPHSPKCPSMGVSLTRSTITTQLRRDIPMMKPAEVPTKLKALLANIQSYIGSEKWYVFPIIGASLKCVLKVCCHSVVFSYWTVTLDLVESMLNEALISYTRIDGQLSADRRGDAIKRFQGDSNIRVILVSISCGGVG